MMLTLRSQKNVLAACIPTETVGFNRNVCRPPPPPLCLPEYTMSVLEITHIIRTLEKE